MESTRVLLVEDEPLVLAITAEVLRDAGFDVAEAGNGDEAVLLLDTNSNFDVVCTDVRMPGIRDGIGVAAYARTLYPAIPVLVVSGYAARLDDRLRTLVPAAKFIAKPYGSAQVVDALRLLTTL
jgi:CheY-like chemotaxis protein